MSQEFEIKPNKRKLRLFVLTLIMIGLAGLWQALNAPQAAKPASATSTTTTTTTTTLPKAVTNDQPGLYTVTKVDDGDTIVVAQGGTTETVRLIGIDTPEVKDPRKPVQCYGAEASAETKSLVSGQKVRLVPDTIGDNRDKYNRLLRYVYLPDGTFVNELLVKQGFAFAYVVFPFDKLDQFKADEKSAEADRLGLWNKCKVNTSTEIKQTNPV